MSLTYGFCLGEEDTLYDSAQFSDAIYALFGDGITPQGGKFSLSVNGMTATLSTGYALVAGRWVENDERLTLPLRASGNNDNRTDAIVVRADYAARKASLEVLTDVDAAAIQADPSILHSGDSYSLVLYLIGVHRGATSVTLDDVIDFRQDPDLCGYFIPIAEAAKPVLYAYKFLTVGLDKEVDRLIELSQKAQAKADAAVQSLGAEIAVTGAAPAIGELLVTSSQPVPAANWLLCDGSSVPDGYPALSAMLESALPAIPVQAEKFYTYIYGGEPVEA